MMKRSSSPQAREQSPGLAIIPAQGLGDAAVLSALAYNGAASGYHPVVFHRFSKEFEKAAQGGIRWKEALSPEAIPEELAGFDTVIVQNDHSRLAHALHEYRVAESAPITFFHRRPSHLYREGDVYADQKKPIAENIATLSRALFDRFDHPKALFAPRAADDSFDVAIHPFSGAAERDWPLRKYLSLAHAIARKGYRPLFIAQSSDAWRLRSIPFETVICGDFAELVDALASVSYFIGNDSGPGHVASLLGCKTVTIGTSAAILAYWRPGFSKGVCCMPPLALPNFRGIGLTLRDKWWHYFISVRNVTKAFFSL